MNKAFTFHRASGVPLATLGIDQTRNPFCTDAYVAAMEMLGHETWMLVAHEENGVTDAAVVLRRRGKIGATLQFLSLPSSASQPEFWDAVNATCTSLKITDLIVGTYASPSIEIPSLAGEYARTDRTEYVISIMNFEKGLSPDHRRNIRKAQLAGLICRHGTRDRDGLLDHSQLIAQSMQRRAARGESVSTNLPEVEEFEAYLRSGAGELFQAIQGETVVSSVLILRSSKSAYSHSLGSSPDGMKVGASRFLISSICQELARRGVQTFNLGGAEKGSSLSHFKAGFGASPVSLSACSCYVGPQWLKKIRPAIRVARTVRRRLLKLLIGNRNSRQYGRPTGATSPALRSSVREDGLQQTAP